MSRVQDTERLPFRPSLPVDARPHPAGSPLPVRLRRAGGHRWRRPFWSEAWRWALVLALWVPVSLFLIVGSLFAAVYWQARNDETRPVDAIVVLGTAQYDGRPGPVLRARLDSALAAYEAGHAPVIVVTGGRQRGDRFTEAEASRDYLIERGVPEAAILSEDEGRTSWESMEAVAALLEPRDLSRVLLVSDGFHLFRLKVMARDLDLTAYGVPATGSPIRRYSPAELDYVVREVGGILAHLWSTRA